MKTSVVVFPGSNCDRDVQRAVSETLDTKVDMVWHEETDFPGTPDLVILPGGFSYGDYLRSGAMAARSPIMKAVRKHAESGRMLLGICNGFQVLTEAHLLPGALLPNTSAYNKGDILQFPIAHHEGLYFLPKDELKALEDDGLVVLRYADPATGEAGAEYAPNGALNGIAGICNKEGNILGLMPHPERATVSHLCGGSDGASFWKSIAKAFAERGGF